MASKVPSQAANKVTKDYLLSGKLPDARHGASFSVYRHPMPIQPIKDPYDVATGAVVGDVDSD